MGRLISICTICMFCTFLAACQTTGGTFCDLASPIRMPDEQIASLTDAQVAEYLGHNRRGAKFCGWQP